MGDVAVKQMRGQNAILVRRVLSGLFVGLVALPAVAKEPITHEDVWVMKRLGTPTISPDGRWVVLSVTEPAYDKDETTRDLWLAPADGSAPPRRLTSTPGSEEDVDWSPDSRRIAFSAKRGDDEVSQIYVLDMTGPGEAQRVTSLSTGASRPKWSPDGRALAFESRVYPGAADEAANQEEAKRREERKHNASRYEEFPIRYWDQWRDDRQTHLVIQTVKPGGEARDLLAGSRLVEGEGYSGVPTRSGEVLQAVWAPDGESLVFVATTNRDQAARAFTQYDLYRVPAGGGEPERLSSGEASFTEPRFAARDRFLYCLTRPINEYAYNVTRVARFGWPEPGRPTILTEGFDRSVSEMVLSPAGETLYLLAHDSGRARVYSMSASGGEARLLNEESRGVYAGLAVPSSGAPRTLVARWEDSTHPGEIVRLDPKSGVHEPLTAFNVEHASRIDWHPFREFWFTTPRGRRIHSWIVLPPGFEESKKYPLLLFIHGGPHSSSLDSGHVRWNPHLMAAPGYVVLLTDYTGSVGYGEEFARLIQGDPLRTPGEELLEAADEAIRRFPFIDPGRQAAAGASYGGHLVNWLQATTDRFQCLIGHAGLIDLEGQWATSDVIYHREINNSGPPWEGSPIWREQSPASFASRFRTPILLTIGEKDYRVPLNQTLAAWSYLKRLEVPSRLLVFHDANHWIMQGHDARYFWEEVHAWLAEHLAD